MLIRILDVETSGLDEAAEVCEIGFCDLVDGQLGGNGSALVKISRPMPPEAQAVHHLSDEELTEFGMSFPEAWHLMLSSVYAADRERKADAPSHAQVHAYAAHNAAFDSRFIGPDWTGKQPWICTMKCAVRAWPDLPAFGNQVVRYSKRLVASNDPRAMPSHAAAADCYVTANILAALLREHSPETLIEWSAQLTAWPRIMFGKHKGQPWNEIPASYLEWMLNKAPDSGDEGWADWQTCAQAELIRRRQHGQSGGRK